MKKLLNFAKYTPKSAGIALMIASAVIIPSALFAWGPSRTPYTIENPADHVVFNSITNNQSHGDERNFVQVRDANSGNETYVDNISLTAGHEYVVYVYYHNNAASNLNASGVGIAKGAYVKAEIPAVVSNGSNGTKAVGYVGAANANPGEVWDDVSFSNTTGGDIAMRYVPGSATIHNFGKTNGVALSDNIITSGASLGYDALDGVLPGCNQYAGYVTFRIKADQPNFTVNKQVRLIATANWLENMDANAGDTVEYRIEYVNTGTTTQNNVVVKDILPAHVTYLTDTTTLKNASNPNGKTVSNNITKDGINIGNYTAGSNAYVKFSAKLDSSSALDCGVNTLTNTAQVETNNGSKLDKAVITVTKQCSTSTPSHNPTHNPTPTPTTTTTPTPTPTTTTTPAPKPVTTVTPVPKQLPTTGAGDDITSILGLGSMITSAGYYLASRRSILGK